MLAYVDYGERDMVGSLRESYTSAMALSGLLLVLIPLAFVALHLRGTRR